MSQFGLKYKRLFCQKGQNKDKLHEAGDWKIENTKHFYKLNVRDCKFCGKRLNEKVVW